MSAWVLVVPVGVVIVLHLVLAHYSSRRSLSGWSALLSPDHDRIIENTKLATSVEEATLLGIGAEARDRTSGLECAGLLLLAQDAIVEVTPNRLERLRSMARLARMAAAMAPTPAVDWRAYRLREAAGVAGLAALVHHFLVTAHERFWLRVQVLGLVYRLAMRAIGTAAGRAPTARASALALFDRAAADWITTDRELVESLRLLLTALAARPKVDPVTVTR